MNPRAGLLLAATVLMPLGASALEVARDVDAVVAAARSAIEKQLGGGYTEVELTVTATPERLPMTHGEVDYHVLPLSGHWPRSRFTEMVEIRSGGKVVRTVSVGFALSAYAPALVYREDINERLPAESLALSEQSVDIAAAGTAPIVSAEVLKGRRLRRPVRAGQIVGADDFEAVPDVDNRQPVKLMASYGGITVERAGVAMRAGNRGEIVSVQVAGTSEPVKATVTDRGVAQVVVP